MSSLAERLLARQHVIGAPAGYVGGKLRNPDGPEAANEIERLREALTEARRYIHETITTRARREIMLAKIDEALSIHEGKPDA